MFSLFASVIPAGIVSVAALYAYARRSMSGLRGDEEADAFTVSYEDDRRDSRASSTSSYHSFTSSPPPSPTRRISNTARQAVAQPLPALLPSKLFSTMDIPPYRAPLCSLAPPPPPLTKRPSPHPTFSIGTLQSYQKEFGVFWSSSQEAFIPIPADLIDVSLYDPIPPPPARPSRSSMNTYHGRKGWGGYSKAAPMQEKEKDEEEDIGFYPEWKIDVMEEDEEELYGLPPIEVDEEGKILGPAFDKYPSTVSSIPLSRRSSSSSSTSSSSSENFPPTPNGSTRLQLGYDFPSSSCKAAALPSAGIADPFAVTA